MRIRTFNLGQIGRAIVLAMAAGSAFAVQGAGPDLEFHLPATSLDGALKMYAQRSQRQLLYPSDLVAHYRSHAVDGRMDADRALAILLDGAPIVVRPLNASTFILSARTDVRSSRQAIPQHRGEPHAAAPMAVVAPPAAPADIVVTGSNIRGQGHETTPLIVLDRSTIERGGFGTISDAVASLPQNFGGTANEETSLTGADRQVPNVGLGRSANLRGLGSDATLTLLNGRRLASSGGLGNFVDLSNIPTAAVARVEVLTDGASALYGSDAIGGVVNVILREDLDGGESGLRLGTVTSGGLQDYMASQLIGTRWSSGHIMLAYEFQRREALSADSRVFARSSDLRPFGGTDHRSYYANPGTLIAYNAAAGAYLPVFAIPSGQDGTHLTASDFAPGANYENEQAGTDLLPRQTRHSAFATLTQDAGPLRLYAEGHFTHRTFEFAGAPSTALISVNGSNPFFVSPTGASSDLIAYSFADELGPIETHGRVTSWSAVGGATAKLIGDWQADLYGNYAEESEASHIDHIANTTLLANAVSGTAAAGYDPATLGYFNPFGSGAINSPALLAYIGQGFSDERVRSTLASVNLKLDGTIVRLPGGPLRAAFGANYRHEGLFRHGSSYFSGATPQPLTVTDTGRSITAVFGELAIPLIGEDNEVPLVRRLTLTAAVRHERYSDFGTTTDPKVGLLFEPVAGVTLRASYGTSFRAPNLRQTTDPRIIAPTQVANAQGQQLPVILIEGGNSGLKPEHATTWNGGVVLAPWARRGPTLQLDYFHTRFTNQIGQPAYENLASVLVDPSLAPFVRRVSPATNSADRAEVVALLAEAGSRLPPGYPPEVFSAILDGRYVNSASVVVQGLDFAIDQTFSVGGGKVDFHTSGTYLVHYRRRISPAAPLTDLVGTLGYPSDFRLRSTLGWTHGAWSVTGALNYVDGYVDTISIPSRPVAAWTTFDAQIARTFGRSAKNGWTLALSAQNLFDRDPPFVNSNAGVGYDAANASALGRFVSLRLTRRW